MPFSHTIEDNQGNVIGFMNEALNPATKVFEKAVVVLPEAKRFHRSRASLVKRESVGVKLADLPDWIGTAKADEQMEVEEIPLMNPVEAPKKSPVLEELEKLKVERVRADKPGSGESASRP